MGRPPHHLTSLRTTLITLAVVLLYAGAMFATNTRLTLLDDESTIIAVAAHPVFPTLAALSDGRFAARASALSDILLPGWMLLTHYSFFALRSSPTSSISIDSYHLSCRGKAASSRAYWFTLLLGFAWPFALQYGRITGWYCVSMFLLSCVTFAYIEVLQIAAMGRGSAWPSLHVARMDQLLWRCSARSVIRGSAALSSTAGAKACRHPVDRVRLHRDQLHPARESRDVAFPGRIPLNE